MKLAEALAERASVQTRLEELAGRLEGSVLVQEGDDPAEDPAELLAEADRLHTRLEWLLRAINHTNAVTPFDGARTITDAIAARDVLGRRQRLFARVAQAATVSGGRYGRSEIRYVSLVSVSELRRAADAGAQEFRELDTRLQGLNWTTELVDPT